MLASACMQASACQVATHFPNGLAHFGGGSCYGCVQTAYAAASLPEKMRVTVHLGAAPRPLAEAGLAAARQLSGHNEADAGTWLAAEVVSATQPLKKKGLYWGYTVRIAPSLQQALSSCPWEVLPCCPDC